MWVFYRLDIAVVAKRHVHLEAEQVIDGAGQAEQALALHVRTVILLKVASGKPEDDWSVVAFPSWKPFELVQVLADDVGGLPLGRRGRMTVCSEFFRLVVDQPRRQLLLLLNLTEVHVGVHGGQVLQNLLAQARIVQLFHVSVQVFERASLAADGEGVKHLHEGWLVVDIDDALEPWLACRVTPLQQVVITEVLRLILVVLGPEVQQAPLSTSKSLHRQHLREQLFRFLFFASVHPRVELTK